MPTNENTYNSRVTSEALEAKFRQVFPSQGGAELVDDLYASGVIQPVIDFSSVAEGSVLAPNLQTAWDFSTGHQTIANAAPTIISNTGFWKIDLNVTYDLAAASFEAKISISDGLGSKPIWELNTSGSSSEGDVATSHEMVVFLRAGDSLIASSSTTNMRLDVVWRQIADVNGNLVNPLGFTFS